jgi:hypothetical protein
MKSRIASAALSAALVLAPSSLVACDREDRADVREGVNDVDRQVDKLDSDGKDD